MSHVKCHMALEFFFFLTLDKDVQLVVGEFVSMGLSSQVNIDLDSFWILQGKHFRWLLMGKIRCLV